MRKQSPSLTATLHVGPNFTGRVLVYVENGVIKADAPVTEEYAVCTVEAFIDLAKQAGWQVSPVSEVAYA